MNASPFRSKARGIAGNLGLVLGSLLLAYTMAEFILFRVALSSVPLNLRAFLPEQAQVLLQTSKAAAVPRDYIALLGDSYAFGLGDWLLAADGRADQPYHSAHVLQRELGQDVVAFARPATGSAHTVLRVTRAFGDPSCIWFPEIPLPSRILVYFYEGNDIDENLDVIDARIRPTTSNLTQEIDRFLDHGFGTISRWLCHGHLADMAFRIARFVVRDRHRPQSLLDLPTANRILIGSREVPAAGMQGPALDIAEADIARGVLVYARSLAWLKRRFAGTPITVVYIPSPPSIYRFAGPALAGSEAANGAAIEVARPDGARFPVTLVHARSQLLCSAIAAATRGEDAGFIDTRPMLREAAKKAPLHGPRDWNHFNEAGYRALGTYLAARIHEKPSDRCDGSWAQ